MLLGIAADAVACTSNTDSLLFSPSSRKMRSYGVDNNLFNAYEPSEVIIGSNYNGIPGKAVNSDVSFAPMTGQIDEIRIFNRALPDAQIKSLFNLGKANK